MSDSIEPVLTDAVDSAEGSAFRQVLNQSLRIFFKDALRISLTNPAQAYFFFKTIRWQRKAARLRTDWARQGIPVPPIMIFSITNRCNLNCKGCFNLALRQSAGDEMSPQKLRGIIAEAKELGISFVVLGGGEPLVRPEILEIIPHFPEMIFLVFTNGLLIDEPVLMKLKRQKNIVPVISIEGYEQDTDQRRGQGIYRRLQPIIENLKNNGIFWSVSITVTSLNYSHITSQQFVPDLVKLGCKLFFLVEYTPISPGTEEWLLTDEQRADLIHWRDSLRARYPALFIAIPGDEEEIGSCLSAGRGFIHISADGNVEPCPFAPYSDANLNRLSLKDALQSEFLRTIRQNHGELRETEGGCALWVKREWVRSVLPSK